MDNAQKMDYLTLAKLSHFTSKEVEIVKELWHSNFHIDWIIITRQFLIKWLGAPNEPHIIDNFYLFLRKNYREDKDYKIENKTIKVLGRCLKFIIMTSGSSVALDVIKIYLKFEQIAAMMMFNINLTKTYERNKKRLRNKDVAIARKIIDLHQSSCNLQNNKNHQIKYKDDIERVITSIVLTNTAFNHSKEDKSHEDLDKKIYQIYLDIVDITDYLASLV
jgi:hypothetical protein